MQRFHVGSVLTAVVGISLLLPAYSFAAAQVFLAPAIERLEAGSSVQTSVAIYADEKINAISGAVQFSSPEPIWVTISKVGSQVDYWVVEPTYDPSTKIAQFEGVILGEGFGPGNGTVLTFTISSNQPATVSARFANGSVLAADGNGTNVLSSFGSGSFLFTEPVIDPVPTEPSEPEPAPVDPTPRPDQIPAEPPSQVIPGPIPSTPPDIDEATGEGIEPGGSVNEPPVNEESGQECASSDASPAQPSECGGEAIVVSMESWWPWSVLVPWLLVLAFALMTVVLAFLLARTSKK